MTRALRVDAIDAYPVFESIDGTKNQALEFRMTPRGICSVNDRRRHKSSRPMSFAQIHLFLVINHIG